MTGSLDSALERISQLADDVGRRTRRWGLFVLGAAVAAWVLLVGRWVFGSPAAFVGWSIVLIALCVPGVILHRFGTRLLGLPPAVDRLAAEVGATASHLRADAGAGVRRARSGGGLRALLKALRELGSHGDRVRSIVADAAGTARIVTIPYLAAVGFAIAGAGVVLTLLLVGTVAALV